jgi:uncharacterized protein
MTGTILNFAAIIVGSLLGLLFGKRLSENLKKTIISGMGLFTTAIGFQMFLKTENALVVLGALLSGAVLGEWWDLEDRLQAMGIWLEKRLTGSSGGSSSTFVRGFLTASILYCSGAMGVLGAISDGLNGDRLTLSIKSVIDGVASLAFASTLGIGVAFSAIPVLIYQGTISLLAANFNTLLNASMLNELTATGGLLLIGVGISSVLEIKKIRIMNFLPALVIAPVLVYLVSLFIK